MPWRGAPTDVSFLFSLAQFQSLYGKKAAALYTQAGDYQKTARFYYKKAEDTYYQVPTPKRNSHHKQRRSAQHAQMKMKTRRSRVDCSSEWCEKALGLWKG